MPDLILSKVPCSWQKILILIILIKIKITISYHNYPLILGRRYLYCSFSFKLIDCPFHFHDLLHSCQYTNVSYKLRQVVVHSASPGSNIFIKMLQFFYPMLKQQNIACFYNDALNSIAHMNIWFDAKVRDDFKDRNHGFIILQFAGGFGVIEQVGYVSYRCLTPIAQDLSHHLP